VGSQDRIGEGKIRDIKAKREKKEKQRRKGRVSKEKQEEGPD